MFKDYIYEAVQPGKELSLEAGTTLFHGTGETIEGDIAPGGYDSIFWTTKSSNIAQSYIPVAGSTMIPDSSSFTKPNQNLIKYQKQLGIVFDADYDAYGRATSFATISPKEFIDADNNYRAGSQEYFKIANELRKDTEEQNKKWKGLGYDLTPEQEIELDNDIKHSNELAKIEKELKQKYYDADSQIIKNNYVTNKLKELGYTPENKGYKEDYSWRLKMDEGRILPADYRLKGKLFIVKLKRKMKFYDMAMDTEPDLTERQYHELGTFEWVMNKGFDGVKINDFAQTEKYGNMGHTSYGFFKNSMKDLDITSINDITHPAEMTEPHSQEYKKHAGLNESIDLPSCFRGNK